MLPIAPRLPAARQPHVRRPDSLAPRAAGHRLPRSPCRRPDYHGPKPSTPGSVAVPPCRSPIAVVPRRRPHAGVPPRFLGRLPCISGVPLLGHRAAPPPCASRARCVGRPSWATCAASAEAKWVVHAGRTSAVSTGHARVAMGRAPALCDWVMRGFGPVALGLDFIFSKYIQFLANSKNCVGFI
jgi:hypothetical protein